MSNPATLSSQNGQPATTECDDVIVIHCSHDEWQQHMRRVAVTTSLLNALMTALSTNPMFAAFIPPELQAAIRTANE